MDLEEIQVKWNRGGAEPAIDYTLFYGNMNKDSEIEDFFRM
jgi:hypothetical protein